MRKIAGIFLMIAAIFVSANFAYAGEIDILLRKLVEKGVLTDGEAQQIATETKEEVRKEIAQGKNETLPSWLQQIKMKGDFRLRYQYDKAKGSRDRNRARVRVRLGTDVKVNDRMKVGVGIATGSVDDPRSTNVTLGGPTSSTPGSFKGVILDYAYAQWNPISWMTLTGGKFKNPLWQPNDLLWDTDFNPEGGVVQLNYKASPKLDLFMNNMVFIMDETKNDISDTYMAALQPGANLAITDKIGLKAAVTYYAFGSLRGKPVFTNNGTWSTGNTKAGANYKYNYNSVNPSMELSVREPLSGLVPYASLFSDFVYNPNPTTGKGGFDVGIKFGAEKVAEKGQWQAKMLFAKLGRDAWLDIFPDSDRYSGKTNMKSWEGVFEYGLGKNSSVALDYYYSKSLTKSTNHYGPAHLLQVDYNLKW